MKMIVLIVVVFGALVADSLLPISESGSPRWCAYQNFPCTGCGDLETEFHIKPENRTVLSEACIFKPNCRQLGWTFGAWPMLGGEGTPVANGGVPQQGNLTLHLEKLRFGVDAWIPDCHYDGNVVLDWEAWTPNWDFNNNPDPSYMSLNYQIYSEKVVKEQHPDWTNATKIIEEARRQFETAAMAFMVGTIKLLRELRPRARMGYYGYPRIAGYNLPIVGTLAREANDKLAPLWNYTTGYFPSVYLPAQHFMPKSLWQDALRTEVNTTIAEAIRVANKFNRAPILPYHWSLYHNDTTTILPEDVKMILQETYVPPLSVGLVIWGGGGYPANFPQFMKTVQGPMFEEAFAWARTCSKEYCANHGWCNSLFKPNQSTTISCTCDVGWSGSNCSKKGKADQLER